MDNEALKKAFKNLHGKITREVNPDSAIDALLPKQIISDDDYYELWNIKDDTSRCRKFLSLLYRSTHPETFIHLREALRDEYRSIVDEVDQQLPSQSTQLQQLQLDQSADGNFLNARLHRGSAARPCIWPWTMKPRPWP